MLNESMKLTGHFSVRLFNEAGSLIQEREVNNVVVTVGKAYLAAWLIAASQAGYFMQYLATGTGTNAATASDTTLQIESATRIAGSLSSASNVWQNQATFGAGVNTGAITEAGIFSASSAGTMLARQVFPVVNKAAGDSMQITWQITLS